jgi:hypothetical protein
MFKYVSKFLLNKNKINLMSKKLGAFMRREFTKILKIFFIILILKSIHKSIKFSKQTLNDEKYVNIINNDSLKTKFEFINLKFFL